MIYIRRRTGTLRKLLGFVCALAVCDILTSGCVNKPPVSASHVEVRASADTFQAAGKATLADVASIDDCVPSGSTSIGASPTGKWDDDAWAKAWPFVHSAQALDQSNNYSAALAQYNKALQIYPEAVDVIVAAGVDQSRVGLKSAAMRSWHDAQTASAYLGVSESAYCIGDSHFLRQEYKAAYDSYFHSLYRHSDSDQPFDTGIQYIDTGAAPLLKAGLEAARNADYSSASKAWEAAYAKASYLQLPNFFLGLAEQQKGDSKKAREYWEQVLINPGYRSPSAHGPDPVQLAALRMLSAFK